MHSCRLTMCAPNGSKSNLKQAMPVINPMLKRLAASLLLLLSLSISVPALAWDSTGHRLSAAVMLEYVDEETRDQLIAILSEHPRFREDFLAEIPRFVDRQNEDAMAEWLLGQAAYWPDIARGLPDTERRRYNRPGWHYENGARMRGATEIQGNVYVDLAEFPDIAGANGDTITSEAMVGNVTTAIDYNVRLLLDNQTPPAQRAVALCWVLHLIGDIHQPLHAGALFSPITFSDGDRGGNGISIGESNLHSRWDRALASGGVVAEKQIILSGMTAAESTAQNLDELDWTIWLNESRNLLQPTVYADFIIDEIRAADSEERSMRALSLPADYVEQMQQVSRQRLGLAGRRLGLLFQSGFSMQTSSTPR